MPQKGIKFAVYSKKKGANMNATPLANLGVNISLDYAKYNALKGESGDYVDFLLRYDAAKSEEGDDSWMNSLFGTGDIFGQLPPKMNAAIAKMGGFEFFASEKKAQEGVSLMVDAQVSALKMELIEGFRKRYEESADDEAVKNSKIAALYEQASTVRLPSRLMG